MSITTGYNTTQNGQVVDIGTLFSSSPSSYWIGSVIWQLNTNPPTFFQNPAAIVQSNITQTTTTRLLQHSIKYCIINIYKNIFGFKLGFK